MIRLNDPRVDYVYTKAGEERALSVGLTNRKAGNPATYGGIPVHGLTAMRWLEKGYIIRKEDYVDEG